MKTKTISAHDIERQWLVADADGRILGRFASRIAQILRGKHKVNFSPNMDMGDHVIVINAEKIRLSGNKENLKTYFRHSGYPGGVTVIDIQQLRRSHPEQIVINAVKGMLPHNRLGRKMLGHLKVYAGADHPHSAQTPKVLDI
ncbi:MAG: 50S ribosomal protein L13 [Candidatus Marinimicrobia bacterium]|nr:50S ribosomal protein L13 [Candidatus Neomarinimicrobiota bacterium]